MSFDESSNILPPQFPVTAQAPKYSFNDPSNESNFPNIVMPTASDDRFSFSWKTNTTQNAPSLCQCPVIEETSNSVSEKASFGIAGPRPSALPLPPLKSDTQENPWLKPSEPLHWNVPSSEDLIPSQSNNSILPSSSKLPPVAPWNASDASKKIDPVLPPWNAPSTPTWDNSNKIVTPQWDSKLPQGTDSTRFLNSWLIPGSSSNIESKTAKFPFANFKNYNSDEKSNQSASGPYNELDTDFEGDQDPKTGTGNNVLPSDAIPSGSGSVDGPGSFVEDGSVQKYLQPFIGRYVRLEFMTDGRYTDRNGILKEVGASYIVWQELGTDKITIGDIYSINFINIYSIDPNSLSTLNKHVKGLENGLAKTSIPMSLD